MRNKNLTQYFLQEGDRCRFCYGINKFCLKSYTQPTVSWNFYDSIVLLAVINLTEWAINHNLLISFIIPQQFYYRSPNDHIQWASGCFVSCCGSLDVQLPGTHRVARDHDWPGLGLCAVNFWCATDACGVPISFPLGVYEILISSIWGCVVQNILICNLWFCGVFTLLYM